MNLLLERGPAPDLKRDLSDLKQERVQDKPMKWKQVYLRNKQKNGYPIGRDEAWAAWLNIAISRLYAKQGVDCS